MAGDKNIIRNDEIDLLVLFKVVWSRRILIAKVSAISLIIGVVLALTSKVEYTSYCKLLPETQSGGGKLGSLGGLAGLAGLDFSGFGTSEALLSPELYPEIVNSAPFIEGLINEPVLFENMDTTISSFTYLKEIDSPSLLGYVVEYTIGLPGKIKGLFSSSESTEPKNYGLLRFSREDWKVMEKYRERLSITVDSKTGVIRISAEMPDAIAASMVTDLLVKELTVAVTNYKIEKSKTNLTFIEERFDEAKKEYESKLDQLARFTDGNRNISTSFFQAEIQRFQNELDVSFEVYKGLATQLEQARIKVKEETPVFTILEPVRVPVKKSKPRRALIVIGFVFFGIFISVSYVVVLNIISKNVK